MLVKTFSFLLISTGCFSLLGNCSLGKKNSAENISDNIEKLHQRKTTNVGKVATVNADEQFVLIKLLNAQSGTKHPLLYVESGVRKATLTPTGESIGSFLAADITKGVVTAGDNVFALDFNEEESSEPLTPLSQPAPPKASSVKETTSEKSELKTEPKVIAEE